MPRLPQNNLERQLSVVRENIFGIMARNGWDIKHLAELTGHSYSTIWTWLNRFERLDFEKVVILADKLGTDVSHLTAKKVWGDLNAGKPN